MEYIQKYCKVSDEGTLTRYLGVHFTSDTIGGWTVDNSPYSTQVKEKFDQYPLQTSPNIPMSTDWHVMTSNWDDYTLDIRYSNITRVLLEYSYGQCQKWGLMWLTIFPYWSYTWQDQQRNLSKLQSHGLTSGHTPLQHLVQNTGIPWITKQDLRYVWCKFCRWPTYKEKSTRTLDFLQQWTYHMEEQPTTHDSSIHNRGWTWQLCKLFKIKRGYWIVWDVHSMVLTYLKTGRLWTRRGRVGRGFLWRAAEFRGWWASRWWCGGGGSFGIPCQCQTHFAFAREERRGHSLDTRWWNEACPEL